MGKFYRDTYAAALAAKATNESNRAAKVATKAMTDALQAAITSVAQKGAFVCILVGNEDLNGSETIRPSSLRIDGKHTFDVPAELLEPISRRLASPFDFLVSSHSVGIITVSWEAPEQSGNQPAANSEPTN